MTPMTYLDRLAVFAAIVATLSAGTLAGPPVATPRTDIAASDVTPKEAAPQDAADPATRRLRIPNTAVTLELVRVPMPAAEDDGDVASTHAVWFLRTEVTWDIYDVFVYRLDEPVEARSDEATGRPSKPYVPPDRGFGHNGFPAMGMTFDAATAFCTWLSEVTGQRFRLPTEAEWMHACRAGADGDFSCGSDPACLPEVAWFADNAGGQTRAAATLAPNAFGLHDMHGNVAEWVVTGERRPIAKGGSYRDDAAALAASARMRQTSSWNASDPQIPKSQWWLADCSWVGFRVVMEEPQE